MLGFENSSLLHLIDIVLVLIPTNWNRIITTCQTINKISELLTPGVWRRMSDLASLKDLGAQRSLYQGTL